MECVRVGDLWRFDNIWADQFLLFGVATSSILLLWSAWLVYIVSALVLYDLSRVSKRTAAALVLALSGHHAPSSIYAELAHIVRNNLPT